MPPLWRNHHCAAQFGIAVLEREIMANLRTHRGLSFLFICFRPIQPIFFALKVNLTVCAS